MVRMEKMEQMVENGIGISIHLLDHQETEVY